MRDTRHHDPLAGRRLPTTLRRARRVAVSTCTARPTFVMRYGRRRSVLDAGAGPGGSRSSSRAAGVDVVGVDVDPSMLAHGPRERARVEWLEHDLDHARPRPRVRRRAPRRQRPALHRRRARSARSSPAAPGTSRRDGVARRGFPARPRLRPRCLRRRLPRRPVSRSASGFRPGRPTPVRPATTTPFRFIASRNVSRGVPFGSKTIVRVREGLMGDEPYAALLASGSSSRSSTAPRAAARSGPASARSSPRSLARHDLTARSRSRNVIVLGAIVWFAGLAVAGALHGIATRASSPTTDGRSRPLGFAVIAFGSLVVHARAEYYTRPHVRSSRWDDPAFDRINVTITLDLGARSRRSHVAPRRDVARHARGVHGVQLGRADRARAIAAHRSRIAGTTSTTTTSSSPIRCATSSSTGRHHRFPTISDGGFAGLQPRDTRRDDCGRRSPST